MNTIELINETIDITLELIFEPGNRSFKRKFIQYIKEILSSDEFGDDKDLSQLRNDLMDFILEKKDYSQEHLQKVLEIIGKLKDFFERDKNFQESDEIKEIKNVIEGKKLLPEKKEEDFDVISGFEEIDEDEIEEIRQTFLEDISEKFEEFDGLLLALESNPKNSDIINKIFRIFHSIKGSGSSLGYKKISETSHKLENIVGNIRDGKMPVSDKFFDLMFKVSDEFKIISRKLKANEPVGEELVYIDESISCYDCAKKEKIADGEKKIVRNDKEGLYSDETIRIKLKKIDKLIDLSSELIVNRGFFSNALDGLIKIRDSFYRKIDEFKYFLEDGTDIQYQEVISSLEDSIIMLTEKIENTTQVFSTKLDHFFFMSSAVQDEILKARMIPFSTVVPSLRRIVRDLSKENKKKIDFNIEGLDTELDKRILELIRDPLIHIIRNAIDHGIEHPEEREKSGKSPRGVINLTAIQKGSQVEIYIEDDGKGIDPDEIREIAVNKKMITSSEAESLNEKEAINLIFMPGFSSKEDITEVSGRGVGLDIVNNNLSELHGIIMVDSRLNKGSKFTMMIPLTLAVSPSLIFNLGTYKLAIVSNLINRVLKIKNYKECKNVFSIKINEVELPVIDLNNILGIKNGCIRSVLNIIYLGTEEKGIGILVDEFLSVEELIIKPMGKIFGGVKHIAGCAVDENGDMIYYLDVKEIIDKGLMIFSKHKDEDIPVISEDISTIYDSLQYFDHLQSSKTDKKIIRGLCFTIKNKEFMVESESVQRLLKINDITDLDTKNGVLRIDDRELDFIDLRKIIPNYKYKNSIYTSIIVMRNENNETAYIVDNIIDLKDIPIDSLKKLRIKNKKSLIIYQVL